MPAKITGDHSKYPECIRDAFQYVTGEVCELRSNYTVYSELFMEEKDMTEKMSDYLGPLLGMFQAMLEDELFLSISRLTDTDSDIHQNLALCALRDGIPYAEDAEFEGKVDKQLKAIRKSAKKIRGHRNRRIAHYELKTSLQKTTLPTVTFSMINATMLLIEEYLNLFYKEFEETTMLYDTLNGHEIYGKAYDTVIKAATYDELEKEGVVRQNEYRLRLIERKSGG